LHRASLTTSLPTRQRFIGPVSPHYKNCIVVYAVIFWRSYVLAVFVALTGLQQYEKLLMHCKYRVIISFKSSTLCQQKSYDEFDGCFMFSFDTMHKYLYRYDVSCN